ncbi:hypothetical protein GOP47_0014919 [Adiantum capillus-veneris]|uniref:Uncharacterized protein n=1 Tax=Adiantum capillus-veneris TaxID=13818 RepID=A0A9D4UN45_ADICA|nr:hypothetical protein GOP47_0014919 [Adiantum capillus-veneris]
METVAGALGLRVQQFSQCFRACKQSWRQKSHEGTRGTFRIQASGPKLMIRLQMKDHVGRLWTAYCQERRQIH